MIIKSFETNKLNFKKNKFVLLYGANDGLKNEFINSFLNKLNIEKTIKFDEKEILANDQIFFDEVLSKSFFDDKKVIQLNRCTDKILKILKYILNKETEEIYVIINSEQLDKKSKLRTKFEKEPNLVCVPFYADNNETLSKLGSSFFRERNISISQSNINSLVNKCNGDRGLLKKELEKIQYFLINKKQITTDELVKLTNLVENHSVTELIDSCLAKNQKKTINILNDNIYSSEDCILIIRTFLNKAKKILKLAEEYKKNNDINLTISSAKPPIFWKDKEITKQQLYKWSPDNIRELIYSVFDLELNIKRNMNNSPNLISDFILEKSKLNTNN